MDRAKQENRIKICAANILKTEFAGLGNLSVQIPAELKTKNTGTSREVRRRGH